MTSRLARWAFRRLVAPRVLAYLVGDRVNGNVTVYTPDEVTVVFRGRV